MIGGGNVQVWLATSPVDMRKSFDGVRIRGHKPNSPPGKKAYDRLCRKPRIAVENLLSLVRESRQNDLHFEADPTENWTNEQVFLQSPCDPLSRSPYDPDWPPCEAHRGTYRLSAFKALLRARTFRARCSHFTLLRVRLGDKALLASNLSTTRTI